MVEKTIEKETERKSCPTCGANVRPNALFCYHCGNSIAPAAVTVEGGKDGEVAGAWLRDELAEEKNGNDSPEKSEVVKDLVAEKPVTSETSVIKSSEKPEALPAENRQHRKGEQIKLQSAAALRQKAKPESKKTVEIIWEEPANTPNVWFLVSAAVLGIAALAALLAMLYMG